MHNVVHTASAAPLQQNLSLLVPDERNNDAINGINGTIMAYFFLTSIGYRVVSCHLHEKIACENWSKVQ